MQWKNPKNTKEFYWTNHALFKMRCYGLSAQKVLGVIKRPERKEEGIVKNTIAVMQLISPKIVNGKKIWKQEVWVMYQTSETEKHKIQNTNHKQIHPVKSSLMRGAALPQFNRVKIISAWRYPGVSPKKNPIPSDILAEVKSLI